MNRRRLIAAVCAASALTLLASAAGNAAEQSNPATWASTLCTSVSNWLGAVQADSTTLTRALNDARHASQTMSVSTARAQLTAYLNELTTATNTAHSAIQAAGTPSVAHGSVFEQTMLNAFSTFSDRLHQSATEVGTFSNNPTTFVSQTTKLGNALSNDGDAAQRAIDSLDSVAGASFEKLASSQASCRKLGA